MKYTRITVVAIALLVAVAGVLMSPARSTLAAHEGTCYNAFLTGAYNLVIVANGDESTNGNDLIIGTAGNDDIDGSNGDDIICGRGGSDFISGRNGNDSLLGDVCDSCELIPGAGPNGAPGNDVIEGRIGNDRLWGDEGNDELYGGTNNDALVGGNPGGDGDETDLCDGESGTDTATRCDDIDGVP